MNVLILGESEFNCQIEGFLTNQGYNPILVEDVTQVRGLSGQIGEFRVGLKDRELCADFVVLTEQPEAKRCDIKGGSVYSIYEKDKAGRLSKKNRLSPIVFLLDYCQESPMAATIKALTDAKMLANKKRRVYYLAKFVRTGGHEVENLYKEARNAGVTFIKYEAVDIAYDNDQDTFKIKANDGVFDVEIETKDIYGDGGLDTAGKFGEVAKKLRLWANADGYLLEDQYYLTPVVTSRKGVFHINRDVGYERLEDGLRYILSNVQTCTLPSENVENTAVVDGEKCVLCYSCYRACPHGAMKPNKEARLMENLPVACAGCGICASVCPGNAITLKNEEAKESLTPKSAKTLLLCCENSAEVAYKKVLPALGDVAAQVELKPVACGGRIGLEQLSQALTEYNKVMVAVCMDDSCRHFDGNKRACRQTERLTEMLETAGLPIDRIKYTQVSHAMPKVLGDTLSGFVRGENE